MASLNRPQNHLIWIRHGTGSKQTEDHQLQSALPPGPWPMSQHPGRGQSESPHALITTSFSWSVAEQQKQTSRNRNSFFPQAVAFINTPYCFITRTEHYNTKRKQIWHTFSTCRLKIKGRCVWLELELNFAGQSIARSRIGHPWYRVSQNWYYQ